MTSRASATADETDRQGRRARDASDSDRLDRLRRESPTDAAQAAEAAWQWLLELTARRHLRRLPALFDQSTAPEHPSVLDGDFQGVVMNLYGSPWLHGLDLLVRLGQALGGIGWTGKSFDATSKTGYNRLSSSSRIPALIATPSYPYTRRDGELLGFHFHWSVDNTPMTPHQSVVAIRYDDPADANPLVLPRTRDELVEIVPGVYLGRALLQDGDDWKVVGHFALRPRREQG